MTTTIRPKDRDAVIQSLRAGVVPRTGQHIIQVGRVNEIAALIKDIERIADNGSGIRFVIGEYGSGKTFFLNLVRISPAGQVRLSALLHKTSGVGEREK